MKTILVLILFVLTLNCSAQNVGVGTLIPSEKLDVNGNINVQGNIKINTIAGTADQVLMTNSSGATVWSNPFGLNKMITFSQSATWVVPAGVTSIVGEAWGAGGGGAAGGGGGGGAYLVTEKLTVVPGSSITITIGLGGIASGSEGSGGTAGGYSEISLAGIGTYDAFGGTGASATVPGYSTAFVLTGDNYVAFQGQGGTATTYQYAPRSSTQYVEIRNYGGGGGVWPNYVNGGRGGSEVLDAGTLAVIKTIPPPFTFLYGSGGGGGHVGSAYGRDGAKGLVVIHY
ncbi:hypothetical protein BH09BAC2_BH09BAC2_10400 [soil metagenome]